MRTVLGSRLVDVAPTAAIVVLACLQAWFEEGTPAASGWLLYVALAALALVPAAAYGRLVRPSWPAAAALGALAALAAWTALSVAWSPLPSVARDEALLTLAYVVALAVPVLTLRTAEARVAALATAVFALGALAIATAAHLRFGSAPLDAYPHNGRLYFPVGYVNAEAALSLVGFWPAIALAARRRTPWPLRAVACGCGGGLLAVALLTQSRGGLAALAASAVVLFAVAPARLRLLLPTLVVAAPAAVAFGPLTATFTAQREGDAALAAAIRDAGSAALLVALAAALGGLAYALFDRRVTLPSTVVSAAGAALGLLLVAAALAAAVIFDREVEDAGRLVDERWEAFKHEPEAETAGTHLLNPGSNRYDFWRVALDEWRAHPVAGIGARGFGPAYLQAGTSGETPARSHSLPLDVLAETGTVGAAFLLAAVAALLAGLVRRRQLATATAAVGAAAFWLVHASVDWIWTFPACGVPFAAIVGIGLARDGERIGRRWGFGVAVAAVAAVVLLFAPPWLSARYVERAIAAGPPGATADLDRARRLDPLAVTPDIVEAQLAASPAQAVRALRRAVEKEPRSVRNQYLLGLALIEAGRPAEARGPLRRAKELFPREPLIDAALAQTGRQ